MTRNEILEIKVARHDINSNITIRQFLNELFVKLWSENENFNSKRPWGNSSWDCDLYVSLIKHNLISGKVDENGYLLELDEDEARRFVIDNLINPLFEETKP